jgi:GNAT superfamily N-acetyltransferase
MIRKAIESDTPQLVEWMKKLIAHAQETSNDPYVINLTKGYETESASWFLNAISSNLCIIFIAEERGVPAGFIAGTTTAPFLMASTIKIIGQIELCWVEPTIRKRGIARKLCLQIEQWFGDVGVKYIDLQYLIGNTEAEISWVKLGYRPYRITSRKEI